MDFDEILSQIRTRYLSRNRFDDDEDTAEAENESANTQDVKTSYGNTRLPFGLCKRFNIEVGDDWTPRDAWDALENGTGLSHDEIIKHIKENGNTNNLKTKSTNSSKAKTSPIKSTTADAKATADLKKQIQTSRGHGASNTGKIALTNLDDGTIIKGSLHYTNGTSKEMYLFKVNGKFYAGNENGILPVKGSKKAISQVHSLASHMTYYDDFGVIPDGVEDSLLDEFTKAEANNVTAKKQDKADTSKYFSTLDQSVEGSFSRRCENNGIEYKVVKKLSKQLSSDEIIKHISGGDETKGSCVSLAFSYIGCKAGFDVKDFRGGKSQDEFAKFNFDRGFKSSGIKAIKDTVPYSTTSSTYSMLNNMEDDTEYVLAAGHHCSIVRKNNGNIQYLELQSGVKNGWIDLKSQKTLSKRFDFKNTSLTSTLIKVDDIQGSKKFHHFLGYLNTRDFEQKKGIEGGEK